MKLVLHQVSLLSIRVMKKNRVISEFKNSQNIPGHGGGHEYVKLD